MKKPMFSQPRIVAVLAAVVFVTGLLPTRWARHVAATPHEVVMAVLTPLSSPLNALSGAVRSGRDREVKLDTGSDLETLVMLRQARAELVEARELLRELTEMRRERPLRGVGLKPAKVTDSAPANQRMTINVGRRDGVDVDMAVTDGGNLVGRISRVGAAAADVDPITAAGTRLAVRICPPGAGDGAPLVVAPVYADDDGRTFFGQVDGGGPVRVGDLAHLDDNGWPTEVQQFVVGVVRDVGKDPSDPALSSRVRIETIRPFERVRRVVVVVPTDALPDD